jgi:hypothetical protein
VPYTPTSPTVVLCQNLASAVQTAWGPTAPSAADWDFFKRYGDADEVGGRARRPAGGVLPERVRVGRRDPGRGRVHALVACLVVERYADAAGDAPKLWTAERVDFVHDEIVKALRFTRSGPPSWNKKLTTLGARVQVCDVEKLVTGGKLFYRLVELDSSNS